MSKRVRYTANQVSTNRFYQMPKFLFEGEFKKGLSNDAKVLYSLLRDRHELSLSNNWVNKNNEVFLIYTREDMADMMGVTQPTLRKSIKMLKDIGLMEEERLGFNRANRIYLNAVDVGNTGVKNSFSPECKNLSVRDENILQSGVKDSFNQECKNLSPNDTDFNHTESIDTDIYQSIPKINKEDGSMDNNITTQTIINEIKEHKGIPYHFKADKELMTKTIHTLADYKVYCNSYEDDIRQSSYNLAIDTLIDMATSENPMTVNGSKINYKHVIDKINESIDFDENILSINIFVGETVNDFEQAIKSKDIKNIVAYMKSCIWNSLLNHKVRFSANLHKMIGGHNNH